MTAQIVIPRATPLGSRNLLLGVILQRRTAVPSFALGMTIRPNSSSVARARDDSANCHSEGDALGLEEPAFGSNSSKTNSSSLARARDDDQTKQQFRRS